MVLQYGVKTIAKNHVSTCKNNWLPTINLLVITYLFSQALRLILCAFQNEVGLTVNASDRFFENIGGCV